jgi:hypothetical protein
VAVVLKPADGRHAEQSARTGAKLLRGQLRCRTLAPGVAEFCRILQTKNSADQIGTGAELPQGRLCRRTTFRRCRILQNSADQFGTTFRRCRILQNFCRPIRYYISALIHKLVQNFCALRYYPTS